MTPQQAAIRSLGADKREFVRLGLLHKAAMARKISELSGFSMFSFPGICDGRSTDVMAKALETAKRLVSEWEVELKKIGYENV